MTDVGIFGLTPHLPRIRVPQQSDKVYKDECVFSFDTPDCETGLYVCLQTFLGLGRDHVERHYQKTGSGVYLHLKRDRFEIEEPQGDGPERKVTRLAIGIEGGFDPNQKTVETVETLSVVVLPEFTFIPWPCDRLPQIIISSIQGILEADSATKKAEIEALAGTWDGEARVVSKHAHNLLQLDNGVKIPPSGWKCEECQLDNNLWLNLSDGSIRCGRRFYDGSGGNEHALLHYKVTGYPLAVKLGTITKDGKGDVYSYDEDDMVEDPFLVQHLAHFGINILSLEKTDKSMVELELDLNQKFGEWSTLLEASAKLKPVSGPGYTGLANMGNSCYLNAVMQVVFSLPDFISRYCDIANQIFEAAPADPAEDFNTQMAKLGTGLLSGKYSLPPQLVGEKKKIIPPVTPHMFKNLIGKGHPAFSTKSQQDAQEFFLHLISTIQRNNRGHRDPTECFKLKVEDRFQCGTSGKVKYTHRTEYCLPLPIPMSAATNKAELAEYEAKKASGQKRDSNKVVRPRIQLSSCLEAFSQVETVEQFYSSAIGEKTIARKTTRLGSFPDYLLIHLKKFSLREDWTPMKLDVAIEMPDILDLTPLRGGGGLQPGEEALPELSVPPPQPVYDEAILSSLVDMGFPIEAAKKAVYFTDSRGLDEASNWVMEHIADDDFADPFIPPGTETNASSAASFVPNEEALNMIMCMGFTREQAIQALKATNNNVERAADWIFSHASELESDDRPVFKEPEYRDGPGKYQLKAFISHMGASSMVGHYVCHILRDGRWIIFNDAKVAFSKSPPKDLGYLYLYQRI